MAVVKVTESWKQLGGKVEGWPGVKPIIVGTPPASSASSSTWPRRTIAERVDRERRDNGGPGGRQLLGQRSDYLTCRNVHVLDPVGPTLFRVICEYSGMVSPFTQARSCATPACGTLRKSGTTRPANPIATRSGSASQGTRAISTTGFSR